MRNKKNNVAYLLHIRDSAIKLLEYINVHSFDDFDNSEWDQAAALRYLEIIGEAASKMELSFRQQYRDIPWREIIDLRNIVIHDYMHVDLRIIWEIMTKDIKELQEKILKVLSTQENV